MPTIYEFIQYIFGGFCTYLSLSIGRHFQFGKSEKTRTRKLAQNLHRHKESTYNNKGKEEWVNGTCIMRMGIRERERVREGKRGCLHEYLVQSMGIPRFWVEKIRI